MGLLTFGINLTLDGCYDHREGIADAELHRYWTRLMVEADGMLWGRHTYELMESAWPPIARDENAPASMRDWAVNLDAAPKYVVSSSRSEYWWQNTIHVDGDLAAEVNKIKAKSPRGVLLGGPALALSLEKLGLIDEYRFVIHPVLAGHGPTLFQGLPGARHLELVASERFASGAIATHYRRKPA